MRIAGFSDVHSNIHALRAVLTDIDAQNCGVIYCLGDLVGYGAFPNEVIELMRERQIPTIMGNYDNGVGFDRDDCGCAYTSDEMRRLGNLSLRWTREHVSVENKAFLRGLLPNIRSELAGRKLLLVHGSPRRVNEYLYEDRPEASMQRIAGAAQADVILSGHTHLPHVRKVGEVLFVNVGSAGKPKDGDSRAAYALLETEPDVRATIRRVSYNVVAAAAAVRASGLPEHFADLLETGGG